MAKKSEYILVDDKLPFNGANTLFLYNTEDSSLYYRDRSSSEWVQITGRAALESHINSTENVHGILDTGLLATQAYVDSAAANAASQAVANLIDSAPDTLNTLNELAAAINDDAEFSSTLASSLAQKLDSSTAASTYLTQANAASTYLTPGNAASTYLTQATASSSYILQSGQTGNIDFSSANIIGLKSTPNEVASTTYSLVSSDSYETVVTTSASTVTITVPPESSVNFPVGTSISILQAGSGQVVLAAGSGVTLNTIGNSGALKNRYQYSICGLYKYASDTWVALGDLVV